MVMTSKINEVDMLEGEIETIIRRELRLPRHLDADIRDAARQICELLKGRRQVHNGTRAGFVATGNDVSCNGRGPTKG